jgi:flagellin
MAALNANNSLAQASKAQQAGMQKLASGFKINSAKDDASGLAITEKMKNQIKALDTAKDNCEDGANMIQTAEGYMKETHDILTRMTELAEKAANGLLKDEDRGALQNEMDQLCGEIDRMASTANFNGVKLMDGSLGSKDKVTVTSTKEGFKYNSPTKGLSYAGAALNGGVTSGPTGTLAQGQTQLESGKYAVSGISSTGTITLKTLTGGSVTTTLQMEAQVGDTVTIGSGGTGMSANGITVQATGVAVGNTFTFKESSTGLKSWECDTDTGISIGTTTLTFNNAATGDIIEWDDAASISKKSLNGIKLQIGDSSTTADRMNVSINSFHTDSLFKGLDGVINHSNDSTDTANSAAVKIKTGNDSSTYKDAVTIDISDKDTASAAADAIRQISNYVSDERGKLGAQQNRLEHTVNNLTTASENTTAAKSRILDTDMAKEMMAYTSKNVIAQAAQSMLAQANSQPQNVLSLLQ